MEHFSRCSPASVAFTRALPPAPWLPSGQTIVLLIYHPARFSASRHGRPSRPWNRRGLTNEPASIASTVINERRLPHDALHIFFVSVRFSAKTRLRVHIFFVSVRFFRSTSSRWKSRIVAIRQNGKRKPSEIGMRREESYSNEKNVHGECDTRRKSNRNENFEQKRKPFGLPDSGIIALPSAAYKQLTYTIAVLFNYRVYTLERAPNLTTEEATG